MLSIGSFPVYKNRSAWKFVALVVVFLALSGCSAPSAATTAAPTLSPTDTILPSITPSPSATNPPTPTITQAVTAAPDLEATQHVQETATQQAGLDKVRADLEKLGLSKDEGQLVYYNPQEITLTIDDDSLYVPEIVYTESLTDFVIQTKTQWTTEKGFSGCGILFHAGVDIDNRPLYMYNIIRMQSSPHWFIWIIKNVYTDWELVNLTASSSIKDSESEINELTLIVKGDQVSPYINGELQGPVYNNLPMDGQIGLDAWSDRNPTTCTFTDTWIWALE